MRLSIIDIADAGMAELADALVSGTSGATRAGSNPVTRTMKRLMIEVISFFVFLYENA